MCKSLWQKAKQCYIVINGRVSLEIDFQTRQQKGEKMKRIAKFHKVSFEQFAEGWLGEFPDSNREEAGKIYEEIYQEYLRPCVEYAKKKENEKCRDLYADMVGSLRQRFAPSHLNRV